MGVLAGSAVLGQGPVCTLLAGVVAGFAVSSTSPESLDGGIIAVVVIDAGESVGEDLEPLVIAAVAASGGDEEVGEQHSVCTRIAAVVGVYIAASSLVEVIALEVEVSGCTPAHVDG